MRKSILKAVGKLSSKNALSVFSLVKVESGTCRVNNLRVELTFTAPGIPDGLYRADALSKLGEWVKDTEGRKPETYPESMPRAACVAVVSSIGEGSLWPKVRGAWKELAACISNDETRYYLQGIGFTAEGVAATNGHTMAYIKNGSGLAQYGGAAAESFIVRPTGSGQEEEAESLNFYASSEGAARFAVFQGEDFFLVSQCIEGRFPNWPQVIPPEKTTLSAVLPDTAALNREKIIRPEYFSRGEYIPYPIQVVEGGSAYFQGKYLKLCAALGVERLEGSAPESAFLGETKNGASFVIMPCRAPNKEE